MGEPRIPEYLTVQEAAAMIHMPVSTLRLKIAEGHLPVFKPGKRLLIKCSDMHAFVKRFSQGNEIKR